MTLWDEINGLLFHPAPLLFHCRSCGQEYDYLDLRSNLLDCGDCADRRAEDAYQEEQASAAYAAWEKGDNGEPETL